MSKENKSLLNSFPLYAILIIGGIITYLACQYFSVSIQQAFACNPTKKLTCATQIRDAIYIPIAIITGTLTAAGFWSLIFRSEQTAQQIDLSSQQMKMASNNNLFNNFIAHKKEFIELINGFEEDLNCTVKGKRQLYSKLYPHNNPSNLDFACNELAIKKMVTNNEERLNTFLNKINGKTDDLNVRDAFEELICELSETLNVTMERDTVTALDGSLVKKLPQDLHNTLFLARRLYQLIADFSEQSESIYKITHNLSPCEEEIKRDVNDNISRFIRCLEQNPPLIRQ